MRTGRIWSHTKLTEFELNSNSSEKNYICEANIERDYAILGLIRVEKG